MKEINKIEDFGNTEFVPKPESFVYKNAGHSFDVKDSIIDFEIGFANEDFSQIKFHSCVFRNPVVFVKCEVFEKFEFIDCTFESDFILRDIKISGSARFWSSKFQSFFKIHNVKFEKLADFYDTTFVNQFILYKVDFLGTTVFTEAEFKKAVLFTYTKITDFLLFTRTKFRKGLDLSLALISGNIIYFGSEISEFPDHKINPKSQDGKYLKAIEETGEIPLSNKLETYRILKKYSKSNDNQILTMDFTKQETETYSKMLKFDKNTIDSKAIFFLNKISNNHTTSWIRGVFFTLIAGLIFYYLAIIGSDDFRFSFSLLPWDELKDVISKYFIFLLPTHKFSEIYSSNNPLNLIFDLLGRIFIGYGIYQTIQAFRKYT